MTATAPIPFIDLKAQRRHIGGAIDAAVARVLEHGQFILGPEVRELESQLAAFSGAKHALSCSSGTDALTLVLLALGIKPGDAVFCPSFTFCATAEVVALLGATPLFVDVAAGTFNMSPAGLERGIATAKRLGLKPAMVIPVDLFGLPADYAEILPIAERHGLKVLADAAQSFGASYRGRSVGTFGVATATSFFPAKPLGCYGDGGAVFTDDDQLIEVLRSLRVHGMGSDKYDNVRLGMTGRLDTIQAAVLIEKLKVFKDEIAARNRAAAAYNAALADVAIVPQVPDGLTSVWAQYTIRLRPGRRAKLAADLAAEGIPTAIYYPKALHQQVAYRHFPTSDGGLAVTERLVEEVISLPMHGYLDEATQGRIIEAVRRALA
jgi:dTDP-4-amino-4,6-dideoxygalactose transaminase